MVTTYQKDVLTVPPDNQGPAVYSHPTRPKAKHQFTAAEDADQHYAPIAHQTRNQDVYG